MCVCVWALSTTQRLKWENARTAAKTKYELIECEMGKGEMRKGQIGKGEMGKGQTGKGQMGKGQIGKGEMRKGDSRYPPAHEASVGS